MTPKALTRKQVAARVGLSYGNLRLYEQALAHCLELRRGRNRAVLYDDHALRLLQDAVALKRDEGWTLPEIARFLEDRCFPAQGGRSGASARDDLCRLRQDIQAITQQNQALFQLGVRIATRLDRLDRQWRELFDGSRQDGRRPRVLPRAVNE